MVFYATRLVILILFISQGMGGSWAQQSRPNILWINAEDISPHLGCYDDPHATTPRIDQLATTGVVYRHAFATAPICSPSRSCLATGLYATSLGTQHLRCEVQIPEQVVPLAVRMRKLGYYCTNTGKSDYNFDPTGIWDAWNTKLAPWNDRKEGQPFFAFITIGETHEGRANFRDRYDQATADLPEDARHDPAMMKLPPFYPDTPEIRRLWANLYDLITVFDTKVGTILDRLEQDGDLENTVVFVFSDHGNGLPRYKRWLNDSGLRVPLIVNVPEKFRELSPHAPGTKSDRLVSFVDFPATALSLAGADVPEILQGKAFLGTKIAPPRKYVYGARDRADDMFEVSRSASDGQYIYVRHFMPDLPYIQPGVIFNDQKESFRELRRLHRAKKLDRFAAQMWAPRKPVEELYDLKNDPHEIDNLANDPSHSPIKDRLQRELRRWILEHRDSGFLPEAEYQIQAQASDRTPFEVVRDAERFDLEATLNMAWQAGDPSVPVSRLAAGLTHEEVGVRYWSAMGVRARGKDAVSAIGALKKAVADDSPSVRIVTAEVLVNLGESELALTRLGKAMEDVRPWVALEAARAAALLGEDAKPLVPIMKRVMDRNRSAPGSPRPYKDFNYASFTGWALETALAACGEPVESAP